jgi:hypothetical protein
MRRYRPTYGAECQPLISSWRCPWGHVAVLPGEPRITHTVRRCLSAPHSRAVSISLGRAQRDLLDTTCQVVVAVVVIARAHADVSRQIPPSAFFSSDLCPLCVVF